MKKFHIISFIFVGIVGALLHFVYEWSGNNAIVGVFSAVNESTWEHLKLAFYPMVVSSIVGYFTIGKDIPNFICSRVKGILIAMSCIVVFFYIYSGVLGRTIDALNIIIFYISIFIGEYFSYRNMFKKSSCNNRVAIAIVLMFFVCFVLFTFFTPEIGIFKDPITNSYGVNSSIDKYLKK